MPLFAKERIERRLAAILAADIAGYSRLMGADEEGTLARLKADRRELIDPKISDHRGRIVKTTGDGALIEFPSVVEAVSCAVAMQRGMLERNAGTPEEKRINFRIGVNLGDIIVDDDDDIYGDDANTAARLEGIAEPGGICISEDTFRQVRRKGRYDEAVSEARRSVRANPGFSVDHMVLAASLAALGRIPEAELAAARVSVLVPNFTIEQNLLRPTGVPAALAAPFTAACRAAGLP